MSCAPTLTAETLSRSSENRRSELVQGELVEMSPVGRKHARAVVRLAGRLDAHVASRQLGEVSTELGSDGYFNGAPDLAVEVMSPEDRASEVMVEVREYLGAGTRLVMRVDPRSET